MQEQLVERLKALTAEFRTGHNRLLELEGHANTLRKNLLRMSGAIQVLEEEIAKGGGEASHPANDGDGVAADEIHFGADPAQKVSGAA